MGVKGLWSLLQPVNRPIKIETLEGKRLAIDSSIWLYQFNATMKDKEGRTLTGAHILGFLRRINKLLFHGIKPVFVFDGGAPTLKRNTIAERKQRKQGANASHAKVAAKLLAAEMRRAAVKHAREKPRPSDAAPIPEVDEEDTGDIIPAGATYLDDSERGRPRRRDSAPPANGGPSGGRKSRARRSSSSSRSQSPVLPEPEDELPKKKKYVAKDPYELPALPSISKRSDDPRLATDDELREFIDDAGLDLDALDTTSAEFQQLPRDTQYDIVNDLRLRSRAPNYHRLQGMLQASRTPLDFSKAQITNLQHRNQLSQQMWKMAGIDSKAFTISTSGGRVAGERGKSYVLMKNEGKEGGWVLGVREDEGTSKKPIEVDADEAEEMDARKILAEKAKVEEKAKKGRIKGRVLSSGKVVSAEDAKEGLEMERRANAPKGDADLAEFRRTQALEALAARYSPQKPKKKAVKPSQSFGPARPAGSAPLFDVDEGPAVNETDEELAARLQAEELVMDLDAPKEEEDDLELARALEESQREFARQSRSKSAVDEKEPVYDSSGDEMEQVTLDGDDVAASLIPDAKANGSDIDKEELSSLLRQASAASRLEGGLRHSGPSSAVAFQDDKDHPVAGTGPRTFAHWTGEDPSYGSGSIRASPAPVKTFGTPLARSVEASSVPPASASQPPLPPPSPTSKHKVQSVILFPFVQPPSSQRHPPTAPPLAQPSKRRIVPVPAPKATTETIALSDSDDDVDMDSVEVTPAPRATAPAAFVAQSPIDLDASSSRTSSPPLQPLSPLSIARTFSATSKRPSPVKKSSSSLGFAAPSDPFPSLRPFLATSGSGSHPSAPLLKKRKSSTVSFSDIPSQAALSSRSSVPKPFVPSRPEADDDDITLEEEKSRSAPLLSSKAPSSTPLNSLSSSNSLTPKPQTTLFDQDEEDGYWSASPPPRIRNIDSQESSDDDTDDHAEEDGHQDAEDAEADNYASFLAAVKGKDLDTVQEELDAEIEKMKKDKRKMTREGDQDVTAQMTGEIQNLLKHYGIPYMTAPMEAEAQCAALAQLNLVDGIITDDSDVFLFGGKQCFKNLFNDFKYAECYVLSDLDKELCLTQDRLVTLAFLLGSDYTAGVPGVGYVTAMEILAEFPEEGDEGLLRFREWWMKVQTGKDTEKETDSKWKRSFKKKHKDSIYLSNDFPNPQVRPAYLHPQVDLSDEPFSWGLPNLHTLRPYLSAELGWLPSKVDTELDPIIKAHSRRSDPSKHKSQQTLDGFFDHTAGGAGGGEYFGTKKRGGGNGAGSKRLREVVERMRERERGEKRKAEEAKEESGSEQSVDSGEEVVVKAKGKGKGKAREVVDALKPKPKSIRPLKATVSDDNESSDGRAKNAKSKTAKTTAAAGRGRGRGRGRGGKGKGALRRAKSPTPTPSPTPSDSSQSVDSQEAEAPSLLASKKKRGRLVRDSDEDEDEVVVTAKKPRPRPKAKVNPRVQVEGEGEDDYLL